MITVELLLENKDRTDEFAMQLEPGDIGFLVNLLEEKNDEVRYAALLILLSRSKIFPDVYSYWKNLCNKFSNSNSYQRSIGILLIAENIKWDAQNQFENIADVYLSCCDDEKFITARQTIQSISKWVIYKQSLIPVIVDKLTKIDLSKRSDSQHKLLLMDIVNIMIEIQKIEPNPDLKKYIFDTITGGYLDKKFLKKIEGIFGVGDLRQFSKDN